jgi:hypothetical protein
MPTSPVKAFQRTVCRALKLAVAGVPVEKEWAAMRHEDGVYSPRLDVAVGPFATGRLRCVSEFDRLVKNHDSFLRCLYRYHLANLRDGAALNPGIDFEHVVNRNPNARCFMAIEIENKVSRKHLMGGAINAAALGRIGIAVGWTAEKVKALVKLRTYLLFLATVGKNTFDPANLLILSKRQLKGALDLLTAKAARTGRQRGTISRPHTDSTNTHSE